MRKIIPKFPLSASIVSNAKLLIFLQEKGIASKVFTFDEATSRRLAEASARVTLGRAAPSLDEAERLLGEIPVLGSGLFSSLFNAWLATLSAACSTACLSRTALYHCAW